MAVTNRRHQQHAPRRRFARCGGRAPPSRLRICRRPTALRAPPSAKYAATPIKNRVPVENAGVGAERKLVHSGSKKYPPASSGTPRTTLPSAAPKKIASSALEMQKTTSHKGAHSGPPIEAAKLDGNSAQHQQPQHHHQRQIESAEAGGIEHRERRRTACRRRPAATLRCRPRPARSRRSRRGARRPCGPRRDARCPAPRSKPSSSTYTAIMKATRQNQSVGMALLLSCAGDGRSRPRDWLGGGAPRDRARFRDRSEQEKDPQQHIRPEEIQSA